MGKFNRGFSSLVQTRCFRSLPEREARQRKTNRTIRWMLVPLTAGLIFIGVDLHKRFNGPAQDPKPAPTSNEGTPTPGTSDTPGTQSLRRTLSSASPHR